MFGGLFASALASFYTTLAERILFYIYGKGRKIYKKEPIWNKILTKASHCRNCNASLNSIYLIPIIGAFIAKGVCNKCNTKFSYYYSLVEFLFLFIFIFNLYFFNNILFSVTFTFFLGHVVVSMMTDYKKYILDYENLPFILFFGIFSMYSLNKNLPGLDNLYTGLGFFIIFFLVSFLYPNGMGMGDVFYISAYSFLVGHPNWIFFLNSAYLLALLTSVITLRKEESFLKKKVPMGFYYGIALILTYIINIYFNIEYIHV